MRGAFTLIEVLVATVIASIAGMALLQMNSNNMHLFKQIQYRSSNSEPISLIALHGDKKYNKTTKSLYDILDRTYEIKNDDLRKYLKDYRVDYSELLIETIKFDESETEPETQEMTSQEEASAPIIQFELIQILAKTEQGQNAILTARTIK
jgi:prepilin-type N-terminal cleavage/methylation domain-containing protein